MTRRTIPARTTDTPTKPVRCAIYTRKSTEEGLDQAFNSLDARREAAEAYIASQKHEGWTCLPDRYDDGGFSGGSMDRPALRRLLTDVEAGRIDCILVYKVDRLSRSLLDFARIMATLDQHGVSFVSVTQQFNTTTSMGRLTLNILLSFAQFEREIIAERTRDKMSAARRKGKWFGGTPLLGYDVDPNGGRLLVNEAEAVRVRTIFQLYLEQESLLDTVHELKRRGWAAKSWTTRAGRTRGGKPFTKGTLFALLTNATYTGQVEFRGTVCPGEHAGIVDAAVWERVQRLLRCNYRAGVSEPTVDSPKSLFTPARTRARRDHRGALGRQLPQVPTDPAPQGNERNDDGVSMHPDQTEEPPPAAVEAPAPFPPPDANHPPQQVPGAVRPIDRGQRVSLQVEPALPHPDDTMQHTAVRPDPDQHDITPPRQPLSGLQLDDVPIVKERSHASAGGGQAHVLPPGDRIADQRREIATGDPARRERLTAGRAGGDGSTGCTPGCPRIAARAREVRR